MGAEWIDIVDTAVKVGLGALISGITTYYITKLKFKEDAELSKKKIYRDLMLEATKQADTYFDFLNEYFSRLHGIFITYEDCDVGDNELNAIYQSLKEHEDKINERRGALYSAQSSFQLLGMNQALVFLAELRNGENELRGFYLKADKTLPSKEFFAYWANKYEPLKKSFRETLSSEFKSNC